MKARTCRTKMVFIWCTKWRQKFGFLDHWRWDLQVVPKRLLRGGSLKSHKMQTNLVYT